MTEEQKLEEAKQLGAKIREMLDRDRRERGEVIEGEATEVRNEPIAQSRVATAR